MQECALSSLTSDVVRLCMRVCVCLCWDLIDWYHAVLNLDDSTMAISAQLSEFLTHQGQVCLFGSLSVIELPLIPFHLLSLFNEF